MIIYPAMDLMGERIVRLQQGKFDDATTYSDEPLEALQRFAEAGAEWTHIVDLDGARMREPVQHELIAALARMSSLRLQVGGGFRTRDQVARMLDAGIARVVIGSLAVREPDTVRRWIGEFGADRITLSLDVNVVDGVPVVAISGWTEDTGTSLWKVVAEYPEARHLLLTDIGQDGMLAGPNFELLEDAVERLAPLNIQASGGVSSLADLERLTTDGAIVGKALWEGRIRLEEALRLVRT
ncbi:1-(5-phosphoribosyl)-5-[(5-phosphoribosylamino)methylideneamino] imidazole-4-carboxamide isomerase [Sphingomonas sediminicola]|uniref:1-(5-phosphoribosyl)-5-[(5- phosphoribosylamino)methylideneamino]imidazole-4- carboxamide isomerase n=1 Tax=Sphingomonas sediminicola TaxID=386874 RepID=UPI003CF8F2F0